MFFLMTGNNKITNYIGWFIKTQYVYYVTLSIIVGLKVIYHPLYGMNNYVLIWGDWLSCALSEGHMIANHPI